MTDSPSVTWPSPARTTLPLRRMDRTVVERISRFVGMSAILDYSSGRGGQSDEIRRRKSLTQRTQGWCWDWVVSGVRAKIFNTEDTGGTRGHRGTLLLKEWSDFVDLRFVFCR